MEVGVEGFVSDGKEVTVVSAGGVVTTSHIEEDGGG